MLPGNVEGESSLGDEIPGVGGYGVATTDSTIGSKAKEKVELDALGVYGDPALLGEAISCSWSCPSKTDCFRV